MDYRISAQRYIDDLGGPNNISTLVNCATRIRAIVHNVEKVLPIVEFKSEGAINVAVHGEMVQIVIGMDAPQILEEMRHLLNIDSVATQLDEYGLTQEEEIARILLECLGLNGNIREVTVAFSQIVVQVVDITWVDPYDVMLQLGIGIEHVERKGNLVYIQIRQAKEIARVLNVLITRQNAIE